MLVGQNRVNDGEIGFASPCTLNSQPQSPGEIESRYRAMLSEVHGYLSGMGITDEFYTITVNTPPEKIVTYTGPEIEKIVPNDDPAIDEVRISRLARGYGLTTGECRQREQTAELKCGSW